MACKACKSENLKKLDGELTVTQPDLKGLSAPPFYVCQRVLVCLDCGFAELVIPALELPALRKGQSTSGS